MMNPVGGPQAWFTAAELAELQLPGLSSAKRKINERAVDERWALRTDAAGFPLARRRQGRGGGTEYHVGVLPPSASTELARRGVLGDAPAAAANDDPNHPPTSSLWSWFDQQSDTVKTEARRRLGAVLQVEALTGSGANWTAATVQAAADAGVGVSTLRAWMSLVRGVAPTDRLAALAPQRKGGGKQVEIDDGAWRFLVSDYLRPERPTFASCYDRLVREYAAPRGLDIPHKKTLERRLEREVAAQVIVSRRFGADALRGMIPPQQRTIAQLSALECVNIDGHRFDVFVKWPDGRIMRPTMVAIQDVYSRKMLAWRIGETENTVLTRLAFADLFRTWGIPRVALMDNGRAFASKAMTGGAATRFRFKKLDGDPTGLLTGLGVEVKFALPYRGSSKPIERAFRDLCDRVAKRPEFAGAYTGNRPDAKPENYGSRAVDLETFQRVVAEGIDAHNRREGRDTEAANQGSFESAFMASYATAPITRATAEQLRMALLESEVVNTCRKSGAIRTFGNVHWDEALSAHRGERVLVTFDPDNLHEPVHVYDLNRRFICTAKAEVKAGFLDKEAASARARREGELRRVTKRREKLHELHSAAELSELMRRPDPEPLAVQPGVVRPLRTRGSAALKPQADMSADPLTADVIDLDARLMKAAARLRVVE